MGVRLAVMMFAIDYLNLRFCEIRSFRNQHLKRAFFLSGALPIEFHVVGTAPKRLLGKEGFLFLLVGVQRGQPFLMGSQLQHLPLVIRNQHHLGFVGRQQNSNFRRRAANAQRRRRRKLK